jgi:uncharacterized protein (TIGR04222 family)
MARCIAVDGRPDQLIARARAGVARIELSLRGRGLWLNPAQLTRARWLSAMPAPAVALFGVVRLIIGAGRDQPIGFRIVMTLVLLIAAAVMAATLPARSRAGDRALRVAKGRHARAIRAPIQQEWALAVALGGVAVLGATPLAAYAQARQPSSMDDTGDSSSDGGGGGGGD